MTHVTVASGHPVRFPVTRWLGHVARWIAAVRHERRKRRALQDLCFAPEHLLRDIGVSRDDLHRMIGERRS